MIFLTGESGSGKSVLLHLAMGLLKPDSGQIFIEGREIETLDESELLAIRGGLMGMVFRKIPCLPDCPFTTTQLTGQPSTVGQRSKSGKL